MPQNYDKLGGGVSAFQEWVHAGNQSKRIPGFSRNASFYPWFGHSHDLRWVLDYHTENQSSIYNPGRQFWQVSTHRRLSSLRLITMAHHNQLILHRQYTLYYSTRIGYRERAREGGGQGERKHARTRTHTDARTHTHLGSRHDA